MTKKKISDFDRLKVRVELIRESNAQPRHSVTSPLEVANLVGHLNKKDREYFLCIHLDTRNIVIGIEEVTIGSLNAAVVHPREILKGALLNNAAGIILVHNHPSGDCDPSEDDIEITNRLVKASEIMGIEAFDHIIVGGGKYFSFKEKNIMPEGGDKSCLTK